MLNSRFRRLVLLAVVVSVGAIGYSYAGGPRARQAGGAPAAEGGCPFAAIRAAFMGTHRAGKEPVNMEADLLAPERALAAAEGDCPEGNCSGAAAGAAFFGAMTHGDIAHQVTKTPDGVMIRISSKKPELVKRIQARFQPLVAADAPATAPVKASRDEIARK